MKFTKDDAARFSAGLTLTPSQAEEWAELANKALGQATVAGADEIEAERYAIRQATGNFRSGAKALSDYKPVKRDPACEIALAEIDPKVADADFQLVLPTGYFFTDYYGELIFTRTFCEVLVKNWKEKALGETVPFLDTDHDRAAANGWLVDLEARDDGLYAKWDFTERGRQLIKDRIYRYYSAHFGELLRVTDGAMVYPVFRGPALTNSPAMKTMPEAHLSDSHGAHGDAENNPRGTADAGIQEDVMELNDVINFAKAAPDADREKIALAAVPGYATLKTEAEALRAANAQLSEQNAALVREKTDKRRAEVIEKALAEGRILPKDKDAWEKRFSAAPDTIAEIIESLPKVVDLKEHGTGDAGKPEAVLSEDEKAVAKGFGQTEAEYAAGQPAKRG
jgi:phage I-like protein